MTEQDKYSELNPGIADRISTNLIGNKLTCALQPQCSWARHYYCVSYAFTEWGVDNVINIPMSLCVTELCGNDVSAFLTLSSTTPWPGPLCSLFFSHRRLCGIPWTMASSRPPSPPSLPGKGYFSAPFERFVRDDAFQFDQITSAFTLLGELPLFLHYVALDLHLNRHCRNLLRFSCWLASTKTPEAQWSSKDEGWRGVQDQQPQDQRFED